MSAQAESIDTNTQYYSVTEPSEGELVLVKFTEQGDGFFVGQLLEYDYTVMMNNSDVTKKRRNANLSKLVPLNKTMVAHVENVDVKARIVQLSLAFLNEDVKDANAGTIQEKLLASFQENKQMESFMKSMSILHKYNYKEIWTKFIHTIDRHRREYNQEENEDDDISIWKYFNDNIDDLDKWVEESGLDETFGERVLELHKKKTFKKDQPLLTRFGIISFGGVEATKQLLTRAFSDIEFKYSCEYESTPYYMFRSLTTDSSKEDHERIFKFIQTEGQKQNPKIFVEIKFVGVNTIPK
jgi:translation initiation factor 2 alpha subunit (eIF-2alpha)